MIVGFAGKAGAGKDTAAKALIQKGFAKRSFAQPLKIVTADFLQLSLEEIDRYKDKQFGGPLYFDMMTSAMLIESLETYIPITEDHDRLITLYSLGKKIYSLREMLQFIGTDIVRDIISPDAWVDFAMADMPELTVFTDVRFSNEKEAIEEKGGICIYVQGPDSKNDTHSSENSVDSLDFDITVENYGSIEKLHREVLKALNLGY